MAVQLGAIGGLGGRSGHAGMAEGGRQSEKGDMTMGDTTIQEVETRKKRILIIEDDASIRKTLSFRLGKLGFDVFQSSDGFEGLDDAKQMQPDLIVLDLRLPGRPG